MDNKAIFKFNSGIGALLCSGCGKIIKTGLEMTQEEWETIQQLDAQYCQECDPSLNVTYTLVRADDSKTLVGNTAHFIEWDEDSAFKKLHDKPQVGYSCILDAYYAPSYTWLTSAITEITEETEHSITFKTLNSTYTLTW